MLEWYIFLVQAVDLKPQKAEEVACVAGQERTGAREGDTRGEREGLPGRPTKIVQLAFYDMSVDISNWSRGSRGKN